MGARSTERSIFNRQWPDVRPHGQIVRARTKTRFWTKSAVSHCESIRDIAGLFGIYECSYIANASTSGMVIAAAAVSTVSIPDINSASPPIS